MPDKRKKRERPSYHDKAAIILAAIRRLVYEQKVRGGAEFGFTMAQIAEEAGYARSQRFMETLHCMADDKMIDKQEWKSGNSHIPDRFWFRLPSTVKQTKFVS